MINKPNAITSDGEDAPRAIADRHDDPLLAVQRHGQAFVEAVGLLGEVPQYRRDLLDIFMVTVADLIDELKGWIKEEGDVG